MLFPAGTLRNVCDGDLGQAEESAQTVPGEPE
jgi:hypothetical protein